MHLNIENRRFTGSKKSLLNNIYKVAIKAGAKEGDVFADFFAGTGVVSDHMRDKGFKIIINDTLMSNVVCYQAWFGKGKFNSQHLTKYIDFFNSLDCSEIKENYFESIYAGKYFSKNDALKIGFVRDYIADLVKKKKINQREESILIASLMYATDKIANTVGHFEHFLSKKPEDKGVFMRQLRIKGGSSSLIYNEDANALVKKVQCDVAYIDPPYNARQYINFYHVLENLVRWEKPKEFEGSSMKFRRNHLKSEYSKSKAFDFFSDLIHQVNAKIIIVSYNNTYNAKSSASNNKISQKQIIDALKKKGIVSVTEIKHKSFSSGKTNFADHKEILYVCKVKK